MATKYDSVVLYLLVHSVSMILLFCMYWCIVFLNGMVSTFESSSDYYLFHFFFFSDAVGSWSLNAFILVGNLVMVTGNSFIFTICCTYMSQFFFEVCHHTLM